MNYQITTKGVSFNVLDPDQYDLLEHASKRKNFSSYIKRLIQRDIDNAFITNHTQQFQSEVDDKIDENLMDGLI